MAGAEIGSEFELIGRLTRRLPLGPDVLAGPGDDCAVMRYRRNEYLLWTTDLLFEGVHFTRETPPESIGWKALAVSVSDIAAMAGRPRYCLVFVGLPAERTGSYASAIYRGLNRLARRYRVQVVGGDTNAFPRLVIGTTVLGTVEKTCLTRRSGARPGDLICVSGPLGRGPESHLSFLPRVREARRIKRRLGATAMIDISDGLLGDFTRISEASRVGGLIRLEEIPIVAGSTPEAALVSGEEFELLFTIPAARSGDARRSGCFVVGEVLPASRGVKVTANGRPYRPRHPGYDHFRK